MLKKPNSLSMRELSLEISDVKVAETTFHYQFLLMGYDFWIYNKAFLCNTDNIGHL